MCKLKTKTEKIFNEAINSISGEPVFTQSQVNSLVEVVMKIMEAIENERETRNGGD